MIDNTAIDEISNQFDGWKSQKMVVALKTLEGNQFIDARKWTTTSGSDELRPSKGLMLKVSDWPRLIVMVNEMISRHASTQK